MGSWGALTLGGSDANNGFDASRRGFGLRGALFGELAEPALSAIFVVVGFDAVQKWSMLMTGRGGGGKH